MRSAPRRRSRSITSVAARSWRPVLRDGCTAARPPSIADLRARLPRCSWRGRATQLLDQGDASLSPDRRADRRSIGPSAAARRGRGPPVGRSARSQGAGGGRFSGTISGGFLISGSSSSSSEWSISGPSGGRGGFLMMIGSPGGRPGGLGRGSGMAWIRRLLVRTAEPGTIAIAGIGLLSRGGGGGANAGPGGSTSPMAAILRPL